MQFSYQHSAKSHTTSYGVIAGGNRLLPFRHASLMLLLCSCQLLIVTSASGMDNNQSEQKLIEKAPISISDDKVSNEQRIIEKYTRKGADTCIKCHDEDYKYPIFPIFYSRHGNTKDKRTPMGQLQCESCHGPGRAHATEPKVGFKRSEIIAFGRKSSTSKQRQNSQCLQCHQKGARTTWEGSAHESGDVLCVDCHRMHVRSDPVLSGRMQAETCYNCHKKQRGEFTRTSVHPVRYGKMLCSQCHNPHGTYSESLLKTSNKNNTCYACHAEKRGPFLWSHAPVQENCSICHEHHGSVNPSLLKKSPPLICQQCHSMAAHPSFAYDNTDLNSPSNMTFVAAKSCLNCHFQIHGSNHPSGVKLMR